MGCKVQWQGDRKGVGIRQTRDRKKIQKSVLDQWKDIRRRFTEIHSLQELPAIFLPNSYLKQIREIRIDLTRSKLGNNTCGELFLIRLFPCEEWRGF